MPGGRGVSTVSRTVRPIVRSRTTTTRWAAVRSTAWPIWAANISRLVGRISGPPARSRSTTREMSWNAQSPLASQPATSQPRAEGLMPAPRVSRRRDPDLPDIVGQELTGEDCLGAPGLADQHSFPLFSRPAHRDDVEAGDTGAQFLHRCAVLMAVFAEDRASVVGHVPPPELPPSRRSRNQAVLPPSTCRTRS